MATLQAASESSILEALGDIAKSTFTCGGNLLAPEIRLSYLNKTGSWVGASFPDMKDVDLQQIIEASTFASFGKGRETVTDKSYRDAYALEPKNFFTSFRLCNTGILGEIGQSLVPDVFNIRAEPYKMNIYTAPTGRFKAHVDTPRGGNMFGSLVVCLPTRFAGGALVTRHGGQQVTYDWSSPVGGPVQSIQWAAFFSDVEHEILPITDGHRVTLTYNLYHCGQLSPIDITTSPFYGTLKAALDHPHFLRHNGSLGFVCQHAYVFEEFDKINIRWEDVVDKIDDLPMEKSTLLSELSYLSAWFKQVLTRRSKFLTLRKVLRNYFGYIEKLIPELSQAIKDAWHRRLQYGTVLTNITWEEVVNMVDDDYEEGFASKLQNRIGGPWIEREIQVSILEKILPNTGGLALKILETLDAMETSYQPLLKGSDRVVVETAKSLGLDVKITPILAPECPEPPYYVNINFHMLFGETGGGKIISNLKVLRMLDTSYGVKSFATGSQLLLLSIVAMMPSFTSVIKQQPFLLLFRSGVRDVKR